MDGDLQRTVLFYAPVRDRRLVTLLGFYQSDIRALTELGWSVVVAHNYRDIARHIRRSEFLFGWWWHKCLPLAIVFRLLRRRVVLTGASNFQCPSVRHFWLRKLLTLAAARVATLNIVISKCEAKDLEPVRRDDVVVVHPGVSSSLRAESIAKTLHPTGVMVAQLNGPSIERKGVDIAIEAATLVRTVRSDFEFHLIGPVAGDGAGWLSKRGRDGGLEGIVVHGELSHDDRDALVASGWVYLQPSRYEGFGLAIAEAMALGVPIVGSARGAVPEVVGAGGVIVDELSPQAFAAEIVRLLDDHGRRRELAEAARRAARRFRIEDRVEQLRRALASTGLDAQVGQQG